MFMTPFNRRFGDFPAFDPFRVFDDMEKAMSRELTTNLSTFKTDIRQEGENYILEADLPGFKKENIHIDLEDGYMTIRAERRSRIEEKDEKDNFIRCERSYGSYARSFDTAGIDVDHMEASFTDGVLTLTMPKLIETVSSPRRLEIR